MNNILKKDLLESVKNLFDKQNQVEDIDTRLNNVLDLKNIVDILEHYEEYEPDIKMMVNRRAKKDKWRRDR